MGVWMAAGLLACSGFADQAVLEASDDSWVNGNLVGDNYGTLSDTRLRYQNTSWGNNHALFKFDLSLLPANIEISSVRMRFWVGLASWPATPTNFAPVAIFRTSGDWNESTVVFSNAPAYNASSVGTLDHFGLSTHPTYFTGTNTISAGGWLEFEDAGTVALVQDWADGTIPNHGITLWCEGDFLGNQRTFRPQTKDHANPAVRPELIVNYTTVAAIQPAQLFSSGCVLQRGKTVPVWGTSAPGETLTLAIKGQSKVTIADTNGNWRVELDPEPAGGPFTMTISGSSSPPTVLVDIYFGDVWILTGQSNMFQTLGWQIASFPDDYPPLPDASDDFDDVRFAIVDVVAVSNAPADDVVMLQSWQRWEADHLADMSTVGYFFARALNAALDANGLQEVPLGIIKVCKGGTAVAQWASAEALAAMGEPLDPANPAPSVYYNGMIAPMQDYPIKGVLWYQGESDANSISRIEQYPLVFRTVVESWREQWGIDFPFYSVQLAPYNTYFSVPGDELWPWMRETQTENLSVTNTAMACIIDGGLQGNIHPPFKDRVGERLARIALADSYGISTAFRNPTFAACQISGADALITFDHVAGGLQTQAVDSQPDADEVAEGFPAVSVSSNELAGFALCGSDQIFYWATRAEIIGANQVRVSNTVDVPEPVAVRYAWQSYPRCNLFNSEGLPSRPFRTDAYDYSTSSGAPVSAVPGYAGWAGGWGVDLGAETNDYDADGLNNLYEFGLGGDPTNGMDRGIFPTFGIEDAGGGSNAFNYVHPQLSDPDSGLIYHLLLNTNLVDGTWVNAGYSVSGTNVTGGTLDFVTNTINMAEREKFIRLVIVQEPSFNVRDFGAIGDGLADDTPAILSAVSAADASPYSAEVFLPAGSYRISSTNDYALQLENLSDVRLKGEGTDTVLLVSNPENGGVGVVNSTNTLLADFTVDYDPLPFTQGTIVAVDTINGTFDLQIDPGYLELGHPCFAAAPQKWGLKVDLDRDVYDVWAYFSSAWSNLGSRVWRMAADDPAYFQQHSLSVGDRYAHKARRYHAYAVGSSFCKGIELQNVTVHASAALATGWLNSSGVVIQGLSVFPKPGSGRLLASNGDGIHAPGCSDGLVITDCVFDGLTDDAINIHGRGGVVISNVSDTEKWVGLPRTPAVFAAGDEIQIYYRGGGFTNATVQSVTQINTVVVEIGFDRALPDLAAGWSDGDKVSNLSRCGQGSLIANNFFGTQRGRGVLLRSHDVTVRDNVFRNPSQAGMAVDLRHEDWYCSEGPAAYNVTIQGNHIEGGTNRWSWASPWISIRSSVGATGVEATSYDSFNVLIESNNFVNIDGSAVSATSARDVRIINNSVHIDSGIKVAGGPTLKLSNAEDIQIVDLDVYDLNPSTYAAVHIKDTVVPGTNGVYIQNLTTELAAGSVDVQDDR